MRKTVGANMAEGMTSGGPCTSYMIYKQADPLPQESPVNGEEMAGRNLGRKI